jgi:hypothetical protein
MYKVSHMVSCIHYNSCNLFNSTHAHTNTLNCNELQMVIATQKPNYNASCKSPHFFIMALSTYLNLPICLFRFVCMFTYLLLR